MLLCSCAIRIVSPTRRLPSRRKAPTIRGLQEGTVLGGGAASSWGRSVYATQVLPVPRLRWPDSPNKTFVLAWRLPSPRSEVRFCATLLLMRAGLQASAQELSRTQMWPPVGEEERDYPCGYWAKVGATGANSPRLPRRQWVAARLKVVWLKGGQCGWTLP
jgi:hypothetical protein